MAPADAAAELAGARFEAYERLVGSLQSRVTVLTDALAQQQQQQQQQKHERDQQHHSHRASADGDDDDNDDNNEDDVAAGDICTDEGDCERNDGGDVDEDDGDGDDDDNGGDSERRFHIVAPPHRHRVPSQGYFAGADVHMRLRAGADADADAAAHSDAGHDSDGRGAYAGSGTEAGAGADLDSEDYWQAHASAAGEGDDSDIGAAELNGYAGRPLAASTGFGVPAFATGMPVADTDEATPNNTVYEVQMGSTPRFASESREPSPAKHARLFPSAVAEEEDDGVNDFDDIGALLNTQWM
jgi:hypothetical protein